MQRRVVRAALAVIAGVVIPATAWTQTAAPSAPAASKPSMTTPVVAVETTTLTGKVTTIDNANRHVVIQGDKGRVMTLHVGPNVPNFDKLKVGDQASFRYTEALGLALAKGNTSEIRSRVEADAAKVAPAGERPGFSAVERTTVVANVFEVDRARGILTVRGTDGVPVDIRVPDKQALAQVNKGDQLVIGYRQASAISIEPAAKR